MGMLAQIVIGGVQLQLKYVKTVSAHPPGGSSLLQLKSQPNVQMWYYFNLLSTTTLADNTE